MDDDETALANIAHGRRCHSAPPMAKQLEIRSTACNSTGEQGEASRCWPTDDKVASQTPMMATGMQSSNSSIGVAMPRQRKDEDVATTCRPTNDAQPPVLNSTMENGKESTCYPPKYDHARSLQRSTSVNHVTASQASGASIDLQLDCGTCLLPEPQSSEDVDGKYLSVGDGSDGAKKQGKRKTMRLCKVKRDRMRKLAEQLTATGTKLEDAEVSEEMKANQFLMMKLRSKLEHVQSQSNLVSVRLAGKVTMGMRPPKVSATSLLQPWVLPQCHGSSCLTAAAATASHATYRPRMLAGVGMAPGCW